MLTDDELDAVICADLATIYDLLQRDATIESFRESLRRIARDCVNAVLEQAARQCGKISDEAWVKHDRNYHPYYIAGISEGAARCVEVLRAIKEQK